MGISGKKTVGKAYSTMAKKTIAFKKEFCFFCKYDTMTAELNRLHSKSESVVR